MTKEEASKWLYEIVKYPTEDTIIRLVAELENENAKLKGECRTCVYTDSPCVHSDYTSKNGTCDHYKNVFDENAELKARVEKQNSDILFLKHLTESLRSQIKALEGQTPWKDIKDKNELIKENTELKEQHYADCKLVDKTSEIIEQLTKAKELLKKSVCIINRLTPTTALLDKNERSSLKQAEQFLKEIEK